MDIHAGERVLTELDRVRLATIASRGARARLLSSPGLDAVLDDALVVPSRRVAPDILTMYSKARLRFVDDGIERELTLCYPGDAEPQAGFVSVLSPIGLALLGQQVGATIRWQSPDGTKLTAVVEAIVFQPEASGDYTT